MKTNRQKRNYQIIWNIISVLAVLSMIIFLLIPLIR